MKQLIDVIRTGDDLAQVYRPTNPRLYGKKLQQGQLVTIFHEQMMFNFCDLEVAVVVWRWLLELWRTTKRIWREML